MDNEELLAKLVESLKSLHTKVDALTADIKEAAKIGSVFEEFGQLMGSGQGGYQALQKVAPGEPVSLAD